MKKIRFIYFDVGGVLHDFSKSFEPTTKKFNIDQEKFFELWWEHENEITRGKIDPNDFWSKAVEKFNLKKAKEFDFIESWTSGYIPIEKSHNLLKKLAKKYPVGLLTNHYLGMIERSIRRGKIPDIAYHVIVSSCKTGYRKPETEIYRIATEKAGFLPEEILFIDDVDKFIEGAKNYGWQTIQFDPKNIDKTIKEIEKKLED